MSAPKASASGSAMMPSIDAVDHIDAEALGRSAQERREELVRDLIALANLDTPSDDVGLLTEGLRQVEQWLVELLGEAASRTWHAGDEYGPVLVLDYPATGPATTVSTRPVVCLAHYDTVFDAGTLDVWPVEVDGDRLSGPGTFDMKGGLVQLVHALRLLDDLSVARPPVRLVINGDEEIGSPFSRPIIESAAEGAVAVLVFEGSAAGGAVKTARKGVGLFDITVTGVESHAGLEPEAGASAVGEIARLVQQLHDAADFHAGTSVNVGVMKGGRRRNVVAGRATCGIDVRVTSLAEQKRIDAVLRELTPSDERISFAVEGGWNRPVMTRTDSVAHLYALARALAGRLGFDLDEASVGGASDGNFVAALGIPVLDGLGAVGDGAHARHEHVSIAGMVERTALAAGILALMGAPPTKDR